MDLFNSLPPHPIPGQSLAREPGNSPWEQPPMLSSINEVVDFYSERLTKEEVMGNILTSLRGDVPIMMMVRMLTKTSVMNGIHSVDVGYVVTPVIVEIIKTIAEVNDVGYIIDANDKKRDMTVPKALVEEVVKETKAKAKEVKPQMRGLMAKGE